MASVTSKPWKSLEAYNPTVSEKRPLSLKVDVDTHDGMRDGVPRLLEVFRSEGVRATFFLSFGPDNAGKAIFNIFKEKGFLKKMLKTRAPNLYGFRTILSGTVLPARPIATKFPELVRQIEAEGHECEIHAWDHRYWQDHIDSMTSDEIREEFMKAQSAYQNILLHPPKAVAAPSWKITPLVIALEAVMGFEYASDLRGGPPCFLKTENGTLSPLQIPTTGPCVEELLTMGIQEEATWITRILDAADTSPFPVIALHAEVEGGPYARFLKDLLQAIRRHSFEVIPLREMAKILLKDKNRIPIRQLTRVALPGRAGWVSSSA